MNSAVHLVSHWAVHLVGHAVVRSVLQLVANLVFQTVAMSGENLVELKDDQWAAHSVVHLVFHWADSSAWHLVEHSVWHLAAKLDVQTAVLLVDRLDGK